jgi:hypothetical protein
MRSARLLRGGCGGDIIIEEEKGLSVWVYSLIDSHGFSKVKLFCMILNFLSKWQIVAKDCLHLTGSFFSSTLFLSQIIN